MSGSDQFDADYFLHGKQTGKSLYEDYRWMPDLTIPMVESIIDHLGITNSDTVLDFGCARGYVVKAFRLLGYCVYGVDISKWAIENVDPYVEEYCKIIYDSPLEVCSGADWIIAKDVLEHIEYVDLVITKLLKAAYKGVFAVVPLSKFHCSRYVIEDYEKDVTHKQRRTLTGWAEMFSRPGWRVEISYRVPGVKDNYFRPGWERGNGFLTARRVEE